MSLQNIPLQCKKTFLVPSNRPLLPAELTMLQQIIYVCSYIFYDNTAEHSTPSKVLYRDLHIRMHILMKTFLLFAENS